MGGRNLTERWRRTMRPLNSHQTFLFDLRLRWSTYLGLEAVKRDNQLTRDLKRSMKQDRLAPVLVEQWFPALERRLKKIQHTIQECARLNGGINNILVG